MSTGYMIEARDIMDVLGISKTKANELIRGMNRELQDSGYIVVAGKVPRAFWETKFFFGTENAGRKGR